MTEQQHENYVNWLSDNEFGSGGVDGPFFDDRGVYYTKRVYTTEFEARPIRENEPVPETRIDYHAEGGPRHYEIRRFYPDWGSRGPFFSLMKSMHERNKGLESSLYPLRQLLKYLHYSVEAYKELT